MDLFASTTCTLRSCCARYNNKGLSEVFANDFVKDFLFLCKSQKSPLKILVEIEEKNGGTCVTTYLVTFTAEMSNY